jgi:hypothetical protein
MIGSLITIACAGHVLVDLPIFMGPVVMLVGWLLFVTRRERRRERANAASPLPGPPSSASA